MDRTWANAHSYRINSKKNHLKRLRKYNIGGQAGRAQYYRRHTMFKGSDSAMPKRGEGREGLNKKMWHSLSIFTIHSLIKS